MINRIKNSEFNRNVLTLLTGTTIAQAIPIAISPILTRIYTPEDFGIYALFFAISSIFGAIVTGRYELAIMLPKKNEDAINIFALGLIITTLLSLILLLIVTLFHNDLINILNNKEISVWLYFIPVTVFFMGLFNLLSYFNNRHKNYKDIANATIIKSILMAVIQLSVGFVKNGASGLISGRVVSVMFANMRLAKTIIQDKNTLSSIRITKIIALAKKYKSFPTYSLGSVLAQALSKHLLDILISSFYSVTTLGFYSLIQRVLGVPSSLVGSAVGHVFFQAATSEKQEHNTAIKTYKSTVKKLLLIATPTFILLFFIIEELFAFVFGEDWRIAGVYATIVTPLFFLRFIYSAISSIYDIFGALKLEFIWQMILLTGIVIILAYSNFSQLPFKEFLYIFSTYSILMYSISFILTYKLARGD